MINKFKHLGFIIDEKGEFIPFGIAHTLEELNNLDITDIEKYCEYRHGFSFKKMVKEEKKNIYELVCDINDGKIDCIAKIAAVNNIVTYVNLSSTIDNEDGLLFLSDDLKIRQRAKIREYIKLFDRCDFFKAIVINKEYNEEEIDRDISKYLDDYLDSEINYCKSR